jgi:hypothetical protein
MKSLLLLFTIIVIARCIYLVDETTGEISRLEKIEQVYETSEDVVNETLTLPADDCIEDQE